MRRSRLGFSLLELILAAAIMAVVGGFGLYSLSRGRDSTQSRGMAQEVAEELKAARQLAISKQKPVAIAFPGGASCQKVYQLEGLSVPVVTRERDYSASYPSSVMFWGLWTGGVNEVLATQEVDSQYRLADWGPLPSSDPVLYFTPSGTVQSNGLAVYNGGEYRLLVSNGVEGTPGSAPSAVHKPYTVRISKAGAVAVTEGVVGASIPERPGLAVPAMTDAVPDYPAPSGSLQISSLTTEPKPTHPPNSNAYTVVPVQGYITLVARATEPHGEAPLLWWTCDRGKFSTDRPITMDYDFERKEWVGRLAWTPPESANPGDTFRLTCHVKNKDGTVSQDLGAAGSVEVARSERIASVNTDGTYENFYVAWMNSHGTNVINLTVPDQVWEQLTPVWAPNGTKLAFYSGDFAPGSDPEGYENFEATLYIVNEDGRYLRKLFSCVGDLTDYMFGPSFSPEGCYVAFSAYDDSTDQVSRVKVQRIYAVDSENPYVLTDGTDMEEHTDVAWHPRGNVILYTYTKYTDDASDDDGIESSGIRAVKFSPTTLPPGSGFVSWDIVPPAADKVIGEAHWCYDGSKVVYTDNGRLKVIEMNPDAHPKGTPPLDVTPNREGTPVKINAASPRFAPDGNLIAVIDYHESDIADDLYVVSSTGASTGYKVTNVGDLYGYCWSPGGAYFIFSTYVDEGLYTVPSTGGSPENITPEGFRSWSTPSWWSH